MSQITQVSQGTYHFGEFQLHLDLHALARRGERVPLGSKAYEVLTCLVVHAGEVVTKSYLLDTVWANSFVEEGTLAQHIFSLRKALGDRADYIVTVPGQGYRFMGAVRYVPPSLPLRPDEGVVQELRETTHVVIEEPMLPAAVAEAKPASVWSRIALLGAVSFVVLSAVAGWLWSRRSVPQGHVSVVLADFTNNTGDATFDRTLKRALEIDLEQSPFMDVLSDSDSAETLEKMGHKTDTALTPAIAREICERNNRQILLMGTISSIGDEYFLTLEATACSTGKRLASAKAQAANKMKVLGALDAVTNRVRAKLGESAKSMASYQVTIEQATTPSLDALTAYSIGNSMAAQGRPPTEALPFYRRAVEFDPQFAMAYDALGTAYFHLNEYDLSLTNLKKAMDLSARVSERERLIIQAHYYGEGQQNVPLGLQTYRLWSTTYPYDSRPVVSLISLYIDIGQPQQGIPFGERALTMQPDNGLLYQALIRAYTHAGRFDEAKSLGARAAQLGKDNSHIHASLWQVAYAEHNAADLARETEWAHSHSDGWYGWFFPDLAANAAGSEGRYRDSEVLFARAVAFAKQEGLDDLADHLLADQAAAEADLRNLADLRATLLRVTKPELNEVALARGRLALGDIAYAEKVLAVESHKPNQSFSAVNLDLPCLRASIALARGLPQDAISALQVAAPYDLADYSMASLRGEAYLKIGRPEQAVAEYRKIVNNPGLDPASPLATLAHLGLARAYVAEKNVPAARTEYGVFLTAWKDADPGLPVLNAAKAELAKLQ
jgi:DNA-binding winged helix-turn-helix (wHTH) protein/tetratricopeptide (TPR) repeat protein